MVVSLTQRNCPFRLIYVCLSYSGIIREAVDHIFDAIEQEKNKTFLLRVSYMEIYNEKVSDLLAPRQSNKDNRKSNGLKILDDNDGTVNIEGITRFLKKIINIELV